MEEDRYGNLRRYSAESNSLVRDCLKGALLTLIREKSYKDISHTLGISLSAVNKHIVQGLRKLRQQFNQ